MKLTNLCVVSVTSICMCSLSACTTVDLSQAAIKQPQEVAAKPAQNIVERAATSLTSMFMAKGWCESDPAEKTQTATNILLNGMSKQNSSGTDTPMPVAVSTRKLSADLSDAYKQVEQTTKAAEVYLVMSADMAELDAELSQLESALLSAREAETGFGISLQTSSNFIVRRKYTALSNSIDALKDVTDAYGERIRTQIAARASVKRS